jgi:hypothetical protein
VERVHQLRTPLEWYQNLIVKDSMCRKGGGPGQPRDGDANVERVRKTLILRSESRAKSVYCYYFVVDSVRKLLDTPSYITFRRGWDFNKMEPHTITAWKCKSSLTTTHPNNAFGEQDNSLCLGLMALSSETSRGGQGVSLQFTTTRNTGWSERIPKVIASANVDMLRT